MRNLEIYCFNGRPSSGKDTQADLLMGPDTSADKLSSGDVIRGAASKKGEFAKYHNLFAPYIEGSNNGKLIPDDVIVESMRQVINDRFAIGIDRLFITGFPRTQLQLPAVDALCEELASKGCCVKLTHVLLDASEEQAISRAAKRRQDAIESGSEIRPDDQPEKIGTRLSEFNNLTQPMIDKLSDEGRLKIVSASGTIEEVFSLTSKATGRYQ